jgi:hypothetical protein
MKTPKAKMQKIEEGWKQKNFFTQNWEKYHTYKLVPSKVAFYSCLKGLYSFSL